MIEGTFKVTSNTKNAPSVGQKHHIHIEPYPTSDLNQVYATMLPK